MRFLFVYELKHTIAQYEEGFLTDQDMALHIVLLLDKYPNSTMVLPQIVHEVPVYVGESF